MRTPTFIIRRILEELDNKHQAEANLRSSSTAQLCYLVHQAIHIFSQSTTPPTGIAPKSYLPFPEWKPPRSVPNGPSDATKAVLHTCVRSQKLPMHVFAALISPAEGPR